ncbi:MAG: ABC transporter permease [Gemmatimonadota bacterium]|nr:ABC transporter permease [Gemmatimonadota bacterium]
MTGRSHPNEAFGGFRLTCSRWVLKIAAALVPRHLRSEWEKQWHADLLHRRQYHLRISQQSGANRPAVQTPGIFFWSLGSFIHALHLFQREWTMDSILQDIRFGLRSFTRRPGLVALAVLSLGLGIGSNATIFSVVDVYLLRPLPHPESENIYWIGMTNSERGWTNMDFTIPAYRDIRDNITGFKLAAYRTPSFNLSGDETPERLLGVSATHEFFHVVGVQPSMGRGFLPEEEIFGNHRVAILSDGLWHRRFGADPGIIGSTILLNGEVHTVIGVMPPRFWFEFPGRDIWTPLVFTGEEERGNHNLDVAGRLQDGFTEQQAQSELTEIAAGVLAANPVDTWTGVSSQTMKDYLFGAEFRSGSMISLVGVMFVLLIACANVANLLLTWAAGRDRELAVRNALGAGRTRIARQLLTESLLVAVLAGIVGVFFAVFGIKAFLSITPSWFPRVEDIALNGRVLAYTGAIALLSGIVFGTLPAFNSTAGNLAASLKEGTRGGTGAKGGKVRQSLVVAEVSLALVLLVASALLVQGFLKITQVDVGLDRTDLLSFRVTLPENAYPDTTAVVGFIEDFESRLAGLPGVETVAASRNLPLLGFSNTLYSVPGEEMAEDDRRPVTGFNYVTPNYFEATDIPLLQGRSLTNSDRVGASRNVVINRTLADRHWPNGDAIGKEIEFSSGRRAIVGIVENSLDAGVGNGEIAMVFMPAYQGQQNSMGWLVETSGAPEGLVASVQRELHAIDPNLPAYNLMPLEAAISDQMGGDTIMAKIMSALAVIAFLLAVGGVYGVMAYSVAQRTREMGIRIAMGAQGMDLITMVLKQGAVLGGIGVTIGIVLGLGVTKSLSVFLYGVSPFDLRAFGLVTATLLGAALLASYLPARKATKVDPVQALRSE